MRISSWLSWLYLCAALGILGIAGKAESSYSDNFIEYRYGAQFKEPGVAHGSQIPKSIIALNHFNTDSWGSNFFNLDALLSSGKDPALDSRHGATEAYLIYRRDMSLSRSISRPIQGLGIVKDLALHAGFDLNYKNTDFAPQKKLLVFGPEIQLKLWDGHLNLAFDISKEWNYNGIVRRNVTFEPAFEFEGNWGFHFSLARTSWQFTGFCNYVAPKGRDGFGAKTRNEVLARPQFLMDIGKIFNKPGILESGVGYEYWLNKFGNDHKHVEGSFAQTVLFITRLHF